MSGSSDPLLCETYELYADDAVRISRFTLTPGTTTGEHAHEFDYVVAPIRGGIVTVTVDGSASEFELVAKTPYQRSRGITHTLTNHSSETIDFVEIEYLG